jgi:hypothetical protein
MIVLVKFLVGLANRLRFHVLYYPEVLSPMRAREMESHRRDVMILPQDKPGAISRRRMVYRIK